MNAIQAKFADARKALNASLIEREEEIDLVLTGIVAREHVLFVGPPGTAKSQTLTNILSWAADAKQFHLQLHKHTAPEDLFGTLDVQKFKESRYARNTSGYLPEAHYAYLDECFKGSAAVRGTLLKVLNERIFRNDGVDLKIPLRSAVAASNEYPAVEDKESAIFDRFLIRKNVKPINTAKGREQYIDRTIAGDLFTPKFTTSIAVSEIDQASDESRKLPFADGVANNYKSILSGLRGEGIMPSDRRQGKAVSVVRAYAYIQGHGAVENEDLEILSHVLWDDPQEQPAKVAQVVGKIANPVGMIVNSRLLEVEQIVAATNQKLPAQAIPAIGKLREILESLKVLKGNGRLAKCIEYVKTTIRTLSSGGVD